VATYEKLVTKPGRVSLKVEDFNNLLQQQGTYVRITPSIICPNRSGGNIDEASTNHPLDCSICNGNQIIDVAASAYNTWAYIAAVKIESQIDQTRFAVKDALMTTKGSVKVHYWYKVELVDHTSQFNQLIKRTSRSYDILRYTPVDLEDGLFCLVDDDGNSYVRDTDYSLSDNQITWLTSNKPNTDTIYSFMYPVLPTFRVIDLIHENRFYYDSDKLSEKVPVALPQQSHIRWDYMAKNVELDDA
jgi:hypothetical protein